jgi:tubulin monoglycylase TTLL3/8
VQKHSEHYGKHENGNKVSYFEFQRYLETWHPDLPVNFYQDVLPRMKQQAIDSIRSVYIRIDPRRREHNFEVRCRQIPGLWARFYAGQFTQAMAN